MWQVIINLTWAILFKSFFCSYIYSAEVSFYRRCLCFEEFSIFDTNQVTEFVIGSSNSTKVKINLSDEVTISSTYNSTESSKYLVDNQKKFKSSKDISSKITFKIKGDFFNEVSFGIESGINYTGISKQHNVNNTSDVFEFEIASNVSNYISGYVGFEISKAKYIFCLDLGLQLNIHSSLDNLKFFIKSKDKFGNNINSFIEILLHRFLDDKKITYSQNSDESKSYLCFLSTLTCYYRSGNNSKMFIKLGIDKRIFEEYFEEIADTILSKIYIDLGISLCSS